MSPRGRYRYEPVQRGWVVTRDMAGTVVDIIDRSQGGAQEALAQRCRELEAAGWTLERRFADSLFVHRGEERHRITIEAYDPMGAGPPRHTTPG